MIGRDCGSGCFFSPPQYLLAALAEAPDGEDRIFPEIHAKKSLGSWIKKLFKRAGIALYDKPLQNMRSTCATVLLEKFPEYLCNAWLGHTGKVADKHYRQVTDEHIAQAAGKSTSTNAVPSGKAVYLYNNQEFTPDYPDETEFWEIAVGSQRRTSPVESIYLYEALAQLGTDTVKYFNEEYGALTIESLFHFCVENEIRLPKISGDFSGYSPVETIVLYEALRHLEPQMAEFFYDEYAGTLTLENLCHFCATYGITIPCIATKEDVGNAKSSENSPQNSIDADAKKAPQEELENQSNRLGRPIGAFCTFRQGCAGIGIKSQLSATCGKFCSFMPVFAVVC